MFGALVKYVKDKKRFTKCSQCGRPVPKGSSIVKTVKFADGSWKKVCKNCLSAMGTKIKNKKRRNVA